MSFSFLMLRCDDMVPVIKAIQFDSPEYHQEVQLRYEVLRKPLGLQFKPEDLQKEFSDFHFGAFQDDRIVGCLILTPVSENEVKMRQVAIASDQQGQGVGRILVEASESWALEKGYETIRLHARDTAVAFYLRLGYESQGPVFSEVGIPHQLMLKKLVRV